jgi:hypothetical protein
MDSRLQPTSFLFQQGPEGKERGGAYLAEREVGLSLLIKSKVEQVVRCPQSHGEA